MHWFLLYLSTTVIYYLPFWYMYMHSIFLLHRIWRYLEVSGDGELIICRDLCCVVSALGATSTM